METLEAVVEEIDGKHHIRIGGGASAISIPISEDRPNRVKEAFNQVIVRIREGLFDIKLTTVGEDLFSQVAEEYIRQLNREVREVHAEMREYGLLDD